MSQRGRGKHHPVSELCNKPLYLYLIREIVSWEVKRPRSRAGGPCRTTGCLGRRWASPAKGPACRSWQSHEGGHPGAPEDCSVLQQASRQQRQPILRGPVWDLQISPGLARIRFFQQARRPILGEWLRPLVQRGAPALRCAQQPPRWPGWRNTSQKRPAPFSCQGCKPAQVDGANVELAAQEVCLVQPGSSRKRPEAQSSTVTKGGQLL